MLLQKLRCFHFKNYHTIELSFATQLNCLIGPNGAGKTNLLDAIHYLSLTRSAFNSIDGQNILHDEQQMAIQGSFIKFGQQYDVKCLVHRDQGKTIETNGKLVDRLRDHLGQFPVVLTTPYDAELIHGKSETRRKFFDAILCQVDPEYLHQLVQYQQVLKHRNSLLKMHAGRRVDEGLLHIYDQQLLPLGRQLYTARKKFMALFYPLLEQHYQYFVDAPEAISLQYESDWNEAGFEERYKENLQEDMRVQRTVLGIHRDDFIGVLNGYTLKKFGSQGQQKSFIIALRLAQFAFIHQWLHCKPLLLLDDIFDKLDDKRIERLMYLVGQQYFGQVLITDAGSTRSVELISQLVVDKALFKIEGGALVKES
jgi:DNA replication and repair protein RecF